MTVVDEPRVVPATAFGRRFRSTTEARWAVFLTVLGVAFEYEPETYDLGAEGWYLPDFWLPDLERFLEVKGSGPHDGYRRARALATVTGHDVLLAHGFGIPTEQYLWRPLPGWMQSVGADSDDEPYAFTACLCGAVGVSFEARTDYIRGHRCRAGDSLSDHRDCPQCPNKWNVDTRLLRAAYDSATSFRPDHR